MTSLCTIKECNSINDNTSHYTADWGAVRYYCDEHWNLMRLFFTKIGGLRCDLCERNHHAETNMDYFKESTVKYCGKYWNMCDTHLNIYEDAIDYFLPLTED